MKWLLTVMLLLATPAVALNIPNPYVVPNNMQSGGSLNKFHNWVLTLRVNKIKVIIPKGGCSSACTFFLLADDVCVHPDAILGFHGPSGYASALFTGLTMLPSPHRGISQSTWEKDVARMKYLYNKRWPGLGDWFVDSGAAEKYGYKLSRIRGSNLNKAFGVPLC